MGLGEEHAVGVGVGVGVLPRARSVRRPPTLRDRNSPGITLRSRPCAQPVLAWPFPPHLGKGRLETRLGGGGLAMTLGYVRTSISNPAQAAIARWQHTKRPAMPSAPPRQTALAGASTSRSSETSGWTGLPPPPARSISFWTPSALAPPAPAAAPAVPARALPPMPAREVRV